MFGYALRHPIKGGDQYKENKAGLTCLTLACFLGRDELFKDMLELSCKEFWRYSNICCSAYPLGALDSIKPSGETSKHFFLSVLNLNLDSKIYSSCIRDFTVYFFKIGALQS